MDAQRPLSLLWSPTGLAWAAFGGQAFALVLALAPGITGDRLVWFGINSLAIQWINFSTLGLLYLGRERLAALRLPWLSAAGLGLLLVSTWMTAGLLWLGFAQPLQLEPGSWRGLLALSTSLAVVVGLLAIAGLQNHLRLRQLAVQASQAQLQALQARIRPHFLFNTLNSAVSLARSDPARTESLLMDMADLFRSALSPASSIPLSEELALCQRYLAIEQARFGERLQTHWEWPASPPSAEVPPLCLQPLLENAVHHGVECAHSPTLIRVHGEADDTMLELTVSNPVHDQCSTRRGHGVGLSSVRARLAAWAPQARLDTWQADGHFHARLHLPLNPPAQVTTR